MITASIVVYHTAAHELLRVINCAVRSAIEILYIIDNSSNDLSLIHISEPTRLQ